ncbi:MAG TPA: hypothetical protein VLF21_00900 [Candidatus Saccharimonadales bacterium]|nr:hypothetical protein [Candidatus Saccharimonadales bacterium]
MKYLCILGRQPEFGLLELESLFGAGSIQSFDAQTCLIDGEIDINKLGGTLKVGRLLYQGEAADLIDLPIDWTKLTKHDGKIVFGLSYYGIKATPRFVTTRGLEVKKRLEGSSRFVAPKSGIQLSAAQIKFNHILDKGFELLVAVSKQEMVVAVTESTQNIDWYSRRDYDRPARSAKVGMLPPKLAQIMINTTSSDKVFDPFCGTGVALQEALLLGRQAQGSDLSPDMVTASRKNLEWLKTEAKLRGIDNLPIWAVAQADARSVGLPVGPAIVSEGYLGENQTARPNDQKYNELKSQIEALYNESLKNWAKQLPPSAQVTITAPVWHTTSGWKGTQIIDSLPDLGYSLRSFSHVNTRELIYRRPDQIVGRQLLLLKKN